MRARALPLLVALSLVCGVAHAELDASRADEHVSRALDEGKYTFCTEPNRPLPTRAIVLCPLASEVKNCAGFAAACDALKTEPPKVPGWLAKLVAALGEAARVIVWILVAVVLGALIVPLVRAWLRARKDKKLADPIEDAPKSKREAKPIDEEEILVSEPEVLLRKAEEHERRGELDRALFSYLAASLRALDLRGAIRIARHVTNGEYVRGCSDGAAKQPLREIVREVDRVQFGKQPPTREAVSRAAQRAIALVRNAPLGLLLLVLACVGGCLPGLGSAKGDPSGDELFHDLMGRQGVKITRPRGPLATLPMPKEGELAPVVLVDTAKTALDEDTESHLVRWVKKGGVLVLIGDPRGWPKDLHGKVSWSTSRDVAVTTWDDGEEHTYRARLAYPRSFTWEGGFTLAQTGDGETFASTRELGEGRVLAMASGELFTNVSLAREGNAAALVAILSVVSRDEIQIARPEDGTTPATNPIMALHRAGLGLGLWHALLAVFLLFLAVGVRLARATPTPPPLRRAFVEHVEATGTLWSRARIAPHALLAYARWADDRIRKRAPRGTDVATWLATRAKQSPDDVAKVLARAHEARTDEAPRGDELLVMKKLGELVAAAER